MILFSRLLSQRNLDSKNVIGYILKLLMESPSPKMRMLFVVMKFSEKKDNFFSIQKNFYHPFLEVFNSKYIDKNIN